MSNMIRRRRIRRSDSRRDRRGRRDHAFDTRRAGLPGRQSVSAGEPPVGRLHHPVQGQADTPWAISRTSTSPENAQIGLFSAGASVVRPSRAPGRGDAGCVVIDNSSQFRYDRRRAARRARGEPGRGRRTSAIATSSRIRTAPPFSSSSPCSRSPRRGGDRAQSTSRPISPSRAPGRDAIDELAAQTAARAQTASRPRPGSIRSRSRSMRCRTSTSSWTTATRRKR